MRAVVLSAVFLLTACTAPRSELDTAALRSAEIVGIEDAPVLLEDGIWEGDPYVQGGASRPRIGLVEEFDIRGEFIESGREDAAVLVWHSTGGTGTRLWLVVLTPGPERPQTLATSLIGDRVQVIHFSYVDEQIRLEIIAQGPQDAACCPGQFERRNFRFVGDNLVGFTEIVGRASTRDLGGEVWQLERLQLGDEEPVSIEVTMEFDRLGNVFGESGCNSYEGTVANSDGRNIEMSVGATSARRCPEDQAEMQAQFLRRLKAAERYSFQNGRLVLQYALEEGADAMSFVSLRP
jgi:heat shock protein HslJ